MLLLNKHCHPSRDECGVGLTCEKMDDDNGACVPTERYTTRVGEPCRHDDDCDSMKCSSVLNNATCEKHGLQHAPRICTVGVADVRVSDFKGN